MWILWKEPKSQFVLVSKFIVIHFILFFYLLNARMEMACDVDVLILLFLSYMHFVIFFQNIPIISLLGNWKLQEESSWLTPLPPWGKTFQTAAGKFCHSGISPLGWEGEPVIPENSLRGTCFPGLISTCCQTRPSGLRLFSGSPRPSLSRGKPQTLAPGWPGNVAG